MTRKHWTVLEAEAAARVPMHARPYCWTHRQNMEWFGVWRCPICTGHWPVTPTDPEASIP